MEAIQKMLVTDP
jgi:hypothetical protein